MQLTEAEQESVRKAEVMARVDMEKEAANSALSDPIITVGEKKAWEDYIMALDVVCLSPSFYSNPKFPPRPNA